MYSSFRTTQRITYPRDDYRVFLMDSNLSRHPYILFSRSRTPPGVTPTGATFGGGSVQKGVKARKLIMMNCTCLRVW